MVDVVIIIVLLAALLAGYSKGLICALVGLVGNIAALILALILAKPVAAATGGRFGTVAAIGEKLQRMIPLPEGFDQALASTDGVSALYMYLNESHLPKGLQQSIVQNVQDQVHALGEGVFMTMAESVAQVVAQYIWQGLVFVLLWLVLGLLIIGGSRLIMGVIHHVPVVGKVDRMLGAAVMMTLVALTLAVLYNALGVFVEMSAADHTVMNAISQSKVLPMLQGLLQLVIAQIG